MADVSVSNLPPSLQKLARQAREASETGNWAHVIDVSDQILQIESGCVTVRKLRQAAHAKTSTRKASRWGKMKGNWSRVQSVPQKNGLATMEGILRADPFNQAGLRDLVGIAQKNNWPETKIFALEELCSIDAQDLNSATALTELYLEREMLARAMIAADRLIKAMPQNASALELYQKVTVAHTMKTGNWEGDGSFRDKLRN
jgi:hypothetical protein